MKDKRTHERQRPPRVTLLVTLTAVFLLGICLPHPALVSSDRKGDVGNKLTAIDTRATESIVKLLTLEKQIIETSSKAVGAVVFVGGGSGVVLSQDGLVLTNNHVVTEARRKLKVRLALAGVLRTAKVLGRYPEGDIALLKIQEEGPYPYLELGDSDSLRPGIRVLALGNPFLLSGDNAFFPKAPADFYPSVSMGIVSALHRNTLFYPDAIQVDVSVNPGNSGGPLVTLDGKVVGINGKIETKFGLSLNSGVGYAVPSGQIRRFLDVLKGANGETVRHGHIRGVVVERRAGDILPGVLVKEVEKGSPSDLAGFRAGDRIIAIDDQRTTTPNRIDGLVKTYPAGSRVKVRLLRGNREIEISAVLEEVKAEKKNGGDNEVE